MRRFVVEAREPTARGSQSLKKKGQDWQAANAGGTQRSLGRAAALRSRAGLRVKAQEAAFAALAHPAYLLNCCACAAAAPAASRVLRGSRSRPSRKVRPRHSSKAILGSVWQAWGAERAQKRARSSPASSALGLCSWSAGAIAPSGASTTPAGPEHACAAVNCSTRRYLGGIVRPVRFHPPGSASRQRCSTNAWVRPTQGR